MHAMFLSGLLLLAAVPAVPAPVVLTCSLPARAAPGEATATIPEQRTFRLAAGQFQEWDAGLKQFGPNLCRAFACVKAPDRTEGNISSASVTYTVGITPAGEGYWRALGATGFAAKQGVCRVVPEPKP